MKITKTQLRRLIKEEKCKLREQGRDVHGTPIGDPVHGDDSPYATPGTAGHGQAMDDLEMELINALSRGMEEGLIADDLNDAWQRALDYVEDMTAGHL